MKNIKSVNYYKKSKCRSRRLFKAMYIPLILSLIIASFSACKKMVEVELPIDKNTSETIYGSTTTAVSAVTGIYAKINSFDGLFVGDAGMSIRTGLMADELTAIIPEFNPEYMNNLDGQSTWGIWTPAYKDFIFRVNSALEGMAASATLPDHSKQVLTGEAKFTRAFVFFYLVNLYGDVPLVINTDFKVNASIARSPQSAVYDQIIKDLTEAQTELTDTYLDKTLANSTEERIRPNKMAATALLARVYLYLGRWQEAETEATKVINDPAYELITDLNQVFLKNSREAIWQLQPNPLDADGANTQDGRWLINPYDGDPFYFLSSFVTDQFEDGDLREASWVTTNLSGMIIPFKYKEGWGSSEQKEYTMVFRIAEQYLIRAETRAHLNKLTGQNSAESDLNTIRSRAGLAAITATTQADILNLIAHERQVELFTEWGHRWFDLKRTGKLNELMSQQVSPVKGSTWAPYKSLLPIPYDEFKYNSSLRGHQNPGYLEQP